MLRSIAPSGISDAALQCLRNALDLTVRARERSRAHDPGSAPDPGYRGLLTAAAKVLSDEPEALAGSAEREGLLKLLVLSEDVARQAIRSGDARWDGIGRPDIELGDLRRRAGYLLPRDPAPASRPGTIDSSAAWKEAS